MELPDILTSLRKPLKNPTRSPAQAGLEPTPRSLGERVQRRWSLEALNSKISYLLEFHYYPG